MIVVCANDTCPEHRVGKDTLDHPHEDIVCGRCGQPVQAAAGDLAPGDRQEEEQ